MDYRQMTFLCVGLLVCAVSASQDCWPGQYYSRAAGVCLPCSGCRDNEVIRRQCYKDQDTLCGVLTQFQFFHPRHGQTTQDEPEVVAKTTVSRPTPSSEIFDDDDKWFTITMVLVGILVVTCVVGVIIVLITCVLCRRKEREIICEPGFTSSCALIRDDSPIAKTVLVDRFKLVTERET